VDEPYLAALKHKEQHLPGHPTTASTPRRRGGSRPSTVHRSQPGSQQPPHAGCSLPIDLGQQSRRPRLAGKPRWPQISRNAATAPTPGTVTSGAVDGHRSRRVFRLWPPPARQRPRSRFCSWPRRSPRSRRPGVCRCGRPACHERWPAGHRRARGDAALPGHRWNELERLGRLVPIPIVLRHDLGRRAHGPRSQVPTCRVYFLEYKRFFRSARSDGPPGQSYQDNLERFTLFSPRSARTVQGAGWIPASFHATIGRRPWCRCT